jgi:hypothetical protein
LRSASETARVGEGLQPSATRVKYAGDVLVGSENGCDLIPVEDFECGTARLPLAHAVFFQRHRPAVVDCVNPTLAPRPAVDLMLGDEFEHEIRCCAREVHKASTPFCAEATLEIVRIELEPRNHLPTVAPSCAPSRFCGLDEHDVGPGFRGVVGGRKSRESPANDTQFGKPITRER